ncbi:MAG: response regulator transcription factor [Firmicutes bacterium]|nr:response regulator transcription factor [Bacillota bacterium]MDD4791618.1 response regulator transcription factor [Bacillota bacterium]
MLRKVLVVDDEASIVELIRFNLEKEGYEVVEAYDGVEALRVVRAESPDLIILDLMLPGIDGIEVCQAVRRESSVPIIMLTAKGEEFDKVLGLSVGADDYVTKPFSIRELVARVKAVLRRQNMNLECEGEPTCARIRTGDLVIDPDTYQVQVRGKSMDFTPKEFELLYLLASNSGRVLTRELILEKVWGYAYPGSTRTVDVHIRRLRQKIEEDDSNPVYIQTVHGVGYRFQHVCEKP